jgi:hypothetical protein
MVGVKLGVASSFLNVRRQSYEISNKRRPTRRLFVLSEADKVMEPLSK